MADMAGEGTVQVTGLMTLQFSWGGLINAIPVDAIHLVRSTKRGTPGPTLCGIDRFAKDAPGWSVGGGVNGPLYEHEACARCADIARDEFDGLPIGGTFKGLFT